MRLSASRQISPITLIASMGYFPLAVSPESMTQSAPSSTALATSDTSARVGRGELVMDSSICVAHTTGLPTMLHLWMMRFCAVTTFSGGISIPRSPRATMTPSVARRMSSKLSRPSWFSIFEMILQLGAPASSRILRISNTCSALRTKEAKMKSTPSSAPSRRSALSFSDTAGRSRIAPGRLTPFLSPIFPALTALHTTRPSSTAETSKLSSPSSRKTVAPGDTAEGSLG
mmetsp:Transcript_32592/g.103865  ORF Transcript_32592/g.103865 Transcript_32592/m.103865 type:complete len:230 (-) Transcript_32592:752-1441(-)